MQFIPVQFGQAYRILGADRKTKEGIAEKLETAFRAKGIQADGAGDFRTDRALLLTGAERDALAEPAYKGQAAYQEYKKTHSEDWSCHSDEPSPAYMDWNRRYNQVFDQLAEQAIPLQENPDGTYSSPKFDFTELQQVLPTFQPPGYLA